MPTLAENIDALRDLVVEQDVQSLGLLTETDVQHFVGDLCGALEEVGYSFPEEMTLGGFLEGLDEVLRVDTELDEGLKQFLGKARSALQRVALKGIAALPKSFHQKQMRKHSIGANDAVDNEDWKGFETHRRKQMFHMKHAQPQQYAAMAKSAKEHGNPKPGSNKDIKFELHGAKKMAHLMKHIKKQASGQELAHALSPHPDHADFDPNIEKAYDAFHKRKPIAPHEKTGVFPHKDVADQTAKMSEPTRTTKTRSETTARTKAPAPTMSKTQATIRAHQSDANSSAKTQIRRMATVIPKSPHMSPKFAGPKKGDTRVYGKPEQDSP